VQKKCEKEVESRQTGGKREIADVKISQISRVSSVAAVRLYAGAQDGDGDAGVSHRQ